MSTAIIYKSFTGTTRQYAKWLAEEVSGELLTFRQADPEKLAGFDTCVIMSGTYCSWMPLVGFLKKRWEVLKDKKVAVVAIGIVPIDDKGSIAAYERIPEPIRAAVKYWKLPGKMGKNKLPNIAPVGPVARENLHPVIDYLGS
jgi:menaquinone-dependent protoporphyrinogen IX oxidase